MRLIPRLPTCCGTGNPCRAMKILPLFALLLGPLLNAQETTPIDLDARRQSVVDLKSHIEMRDQRLLESVTEIRALDDRNEKRIDSIVNTLATLKASESSKTRINTLKGEVIAACGNRSLSIRASFARF